MIPTLFNYTRMQALFATDTSSYDQATNANTVTLLNAAFSPGPNTLYSGLSPATFVGSNPLSQPVGAATQFHDPATGLYGVLIPPPAGGWVWTCTTAPGTPETIFGYVLTTKTPATNTFGSNLLPTPSIITIVGDTVVIPAIAFGLVPGAFQSIYA